MGSGMTKKDGKFKMWYLAGAGVLPQRRQSDLLYRICRIGRRQVLTKPVLDIWNQTNIVDTCNRDAATIWLDKQEKDPSKRYKMFNVERRPTDRRWQFILKYSSDGIHWGEGVAQSGDLYDRSSAFYNPFRDVGIEYALRDNSFFPAHAVIWKIKTRKWQ